MNLLPICVSTTSTEEKRTLKEYANEFQKWKETEIGLKEIQHHQEHENYFKILSTKMFIQIQTIKT